MLIQAMRDVEARATIIGGGPLLEDLKRLAADLGVSDRIDFTGRLSRREVKILLHASEIFAFPSVNDAEAFGVAQIEAMAAGLPVVNTQLHTNVPWVARHDQEALTVAPNDPAAFARALNTILDQPALAQRLGAAARVRATSEFSLEAFRARMAAVYKDAVAARKTLK